MLFTIYIILFGIYFLASLLLVAKQYETLSSTGFFTITKESIRATSTLKK